MSAGDAEDEKEKRRKGERPKSEWAMADRLGRMEIEGDDPRTEETGGHVLMAQEAERIVENLRRFTLEEVGSSAWMAQHAEIEKLNQQSHASARDKSDEFVLEAVLTFEKLDVLIYDLVLIEAWRENVLPLLFDDIASEDRRTKAMRCYFVLYHEATVVNLLECLCYHSHVITAMKDATLDLLDYCARRLVALQAKAAEFRESASLATNESASEFALKMESRTAAEELLQQMRDIEFAASVSCVAVVRFLCEHVGELSVSSISRLLAKHDFMCSVVPLIENPPWTRQRTGEKTRTWQKLVEGKWVTLERDRLLDVTKLEAQAWLALYHLTMHPEVRKRYGFDAYRKQTLLRSRRFLNATLLDQLPLLADLQRFMDELVLVDAPEPTALNTSSQLLMEQVAAQRELVLRGVDFEACAAKQRESIWLVPDAPEGDADLAKLVDIYAGSEEEEPALDLDELIKGQRSEVRICNLGTSETCYAVPADLAAKTVQTENGPFRREKWSVEGMTLNADSNLLVEVSLKAEAITLELQGEESLPRSFEPAPKRKIWRQFGAVEEGITVQLQLTLQPRQGDEPTYKIAEVFVSTKEQGTLSLD